MWGKDYKGLKIEHNNYVIKISKMNENIIIGSSKKYVKKIRIADTNNRTIKKDITVCFPEKNVQNETELHHNLIQNNSKSKLEDVSFSLQSFINFFVDNPCRNYAQQRNNFNKILCKLLTHIKTCHVPCYDIICKEYNKHSVEKFKCSDDLQMTLVYNIKMIIMMYILKKAIYYARTPDVLWVDRIVNKYSNLLFSPGVQGWLCIEKSIHNVDFNEKTPGYKVIQNSDKLNVNNDMNISTINNVNNTKINIENISLDENNDQIEFCVHLLFCDKHGEYVMNFLVSENQMLPKRSDTFFICTCNMTRNEEISNYISVFIKERVLMMNKIRDYAYDFIKIEYGEDIKLIRHYYDYCELLLTTVFPYRRYECSKCKKYSYTTINSLCICCINLKNQNDLKKNIYVIIDMLQILNQLNGIYFEDLKSQCMKYECFDCNDFSEIICFEFKKTIVDILFLKKFSVNIFFNVIVVFIQFLQYFKIEVFIDKFCKHFDSGIKFGYIVKGYSIKNNQIAICVTMLRCCDTNIDIHDAKNTFRFVFYTCNFDDLHDIIDEKINAHFQIPLRIYSLMNLFNQICFIGFIKQLTSFLCDGAEENCNIIDYVISDYNGYKKYSNKRIEVGGETLSVNNNYLSAIFNGNDIIYNLDDCDNDEEIKWKKYYNEYFCNGNNLVYDILCDVNIYFKNWCSIKCKKCKICSNFLHISYHSCCIRCYLDCDWISSCAQDYECLVKKFNNIPYEQNIVDMIISLVNNTNFPRSYNTLLGYNKHIKLRTQKKILLGILFEYLLFNNINKHKYCIEKIQKYEIGPRSNSHWRNDIFCMMICEDAYFIQNCTSIARELHLHSFSNQYYDFVGTINNSFFAVEVDDFSHDTIKGQNNDNERNIICDIYDIKLFRCDLRNLQKNSSSLPAIEKVFANFREEFIDFCQGVKC
jgi:hypothetical protein